jgi:hypothetical protein
MDIKAIVLTMSGSAKCYTKTISTDLFRLCIMRYLYETWNIVTAGSHIT